ncbi:MAG TPA: ATP-binding protein [Candidatus Thermoplasmatota archaeon]|nr:ATP-binding protein [Candidatus Thermoplasmatota archaeon]
MTTHRTPAPLNGTPQDVPGWISEVGPRGAKVLADASGILASSYDEGHFLRDFARFCVQDLGDWVILYLVERDGSLRRAEGAHAETGKEAILHEILRLPPLQLGDRRHPAAQAVASGRGLLFPHDLGGALATDGRHRALLARVGDASGVVVPMRARGRILGAIVVASATRRYQHADVALCEALGRLAGIGLDNARLFAGEQVSRREAERAALRMARLQATTAALAEAITSQRVADVAVREIRAAAGAREATMLFVDGDALEVAASSADEPLGARMAAASRPGHHDAIARGAPLFGAPSVPERVVLPIAVQGRVVATLELHFAQGVEFAIEERTFLEALSRQCGQALDRARLFQAEQQALADAEASLAALRESEARYRLLADHSSDMISRLSPDGETRYVSPASRRLLGVEPSDLVGRSYAHRAHPEDAPRLHPPAKLLGEDDTFTLTYRLRRADGVDVWIETTGRGIREEGRLVEVVAVSRDISERRATEQEMEAGRRQVARSEKLSALGSLVSGVAHEIRTPLAYLTNNLFLMQARLERAERDGGDARELAEAIGKMAREAIEGTDRINLLVRDLGRFTRQPAGGRTRASLHGVVADALRLWQATHRQVVLESALHPTPLVEIDSVQAQQVVLNLLDNAADAMGASAVVRVETLGADGDALLIVSDTGPGIPPDVQARMWDPFFTTKKEGTGLGLSIVKRIAETHGATVACDSKPGAGTRFTIRFPALPA